jgi:hypothetical protein
MVDGILSGRLPVQGMTAIRVTSVDDGIILDSIDLR